MEGEKKMNQIISWVCLISICFLALQVMIFICEDILKLFNTVSFQNKKSVQKAAISNVTYNYKNKIAK